MEQKKEKSKKKDKHVKTNTHEKCPTKKGNEQTSFFLIWRSV